MAPNVRHPSMSRCQPWRCRRTCLESASAGSTWESASEDTRRPYRFRQQAPTCTVDPSAKSTPSLVNRDGTVQAGVDGSSTVLLGPPRRPRSWSSGARMTAASQSLTVAQILKAVKLTGPNSQLPRCPPHTHPSRCAYKRPAFPQQCRARSVL